MKEKNFFPHFLNSPPALIRSVIYTGQIFIKKLRYCVSEDELMQEGFIAIWQAWQRLSNSNKKEGILNFEAYTISILKKEIKWALHNYINFMYARNPEKPLS